MPPIKHEFAAFILTHGRADNVITYDRLREHGYTGPIFLVIDDEDKQGAMYRERYGDQVVEFSKAEIAKQFDEAGNFKDRRSIFYARNACWQIARDLGVEYFIQLDDDYTAFLYRLDENGKPGHKKIPLDWHFKAMRDYLEATPFASVAMAQGGDYIGGSEGAFLTGFKGMRKAMNTFVCKTDRPFPFLGRINEDVSTYTALQRNGLPFLTISAASVNQKSTQSNAGGMTDIYEASGTYIKSFYSVLFCPSAVHVSSLSSPRERDGVKYEGHMRLHHKINWNACAPKIIREEHRKSSKNGRT